MVTGTPACPNYPIRACQDGTFREARANGPMVFGPCPCPSFEPGLVA